jgi:PAS domain S-box-containing protein
LDHGAPARKGSPFAGELQWRRTRAPEPTVLNSEPSRRYGVSATPAIFAQLVAEWNVMTDQPQEDRYRLLVESVTDYAIYMLDVGGHVTSWNAGARRFKGYQEREILGRHFSTFYPEDAKAAGLPRRALETAEREGRFEGEGWRVRKDQTRFWAHVVIDPIRDSAGVLRGFAKITRDLTDKHAAEEALRRSEQQFRLLVQGVTDYAIYMLDPRGYITNWNVGGERLKGYTAEDIVGEHFSKFYTPEDRDAGEPARALETAARESRYEKEGWRVRKDGERFFANVVIDAIRDDDGALIGFAKITRDITERRRAEQNLASARDALAQSQKIEAVGRLTGGVAHDFNNLLMAILASLELLKKRLPDDLAMRRLVDNAVEGAHRGAALTQRMLAFARRQDLDPKPTDIPELVRGMTELIERSLGPTMTVELRFPLELRPAVVDGNQLELALLSLVVNARDAMSGKGKVVISAHEETVPNGAEGAQPRFICLAVADSGEGMDAETLQRATEPFFTTKGIGKGTGLGLSTVHGLAQQSGGRLVLKSRRGEGAVAEIWLPVAEAGRPASARDALAAAEPELGARALSVLAVDDDLLVLLNTVAMLEDLGHTVHSASSGEAALEIVANEPGIDLVLTDVAMPRMNGVQLAAAIRRQRPDTPIILATGYAEIPPELDAGYPRLSKPFRQQELRRAVDSAISGRFARKVG